MLAIIHMISPQSKSHNLEGRKKNKKNPQNNKKKTPQTPIHSSYSSKVVFKGGYLSGVTQIKEGLSFYIKEVALSVPQGLNLPR